MGEQHDCGIEGGIEDIEEEDRDNPRNNSLGGGGIDNSFLTVFSSCSRQWMPLLSSSSLVLLLEFDNETDCGTMDRRIIRTIFGGSNSEEEEEEEELTSGVW